MISCLLLYLIPLREYVYQGRDLSASVCYYRESPDDGALGCCVDESMVKEKEDAEQIYITTPYADLPSGSYQVTIVYSTDNPDHKYAFTSKYRLDSVVAGHNGNRIPMNANHAAYTFLSLIPVKEFQVHINYSGSGRLFVESISIEQTNALRNILLFFLVLFSLFTDGLILWLRRQPEISRSKARVTVAALVGMALFASLPLMNFFLLNGDDQGFHLNRIEAIKTALLAGVFPNRVSTWWNEGYGYANAIFYGELFLYIPAFLRILGFSVQGAYKCYVVLINLLTAFTAYYSFCKVFHKTRVAMLGSAAWMFAPYRLVCLYQRAAVGEYTAMLFFPLIFCGLMQIYFDGEENAESISDQNRCLPLIIGISGIIQSHIISCVITGGFIALFCLLFFRKTFSPARFFRLVKAVTWTFFLNLWFLLPFADYWRLDYTGHPIAVEWTGRMNSFGVFLNQMFTLFQSGYENAYIVAESGGVVTERNYALGVFMAAAVFYFFYRLCRKTEQSKLTKTGDYSLALAVLSGWMCTIWFPWSGIQQMNGLLHMIIRNIQFPWRFLGITCFFLTITMICLLCLLEKEENKILYHTAFVVLSVLIFVSADRYMYDYERTVEKYRYDNEAKLNSQGVGGGEYLPGDTPYDFADSTESAPGDRVKVLAESNVGNGRYVTCKNAGETESYIDLPLLPYRDFVCRNQDTGEKLETQFSVPGRLRVILPGGYDGTLSVRFEEPWYWRAAEVVSLLSVLGLIVMQSARRKERTV